MLCYARDVSQKMVDDYRAKQKKRQRPSGVADKTICRGPIRCERGFGTRNPIGNVSADSAAGPAVLW